MNQCTKPLQKLSKEVNNTINIEKLMIEMKGIPLNHNIYVVVQKCVDRSPTQYFYINQLMSLYYLFVLS